MSTTERNHAPGDGTVTGDLLVTDVDIVTVQKLLGHASVQTTTSYDRHGARATQQAVGMVHIP